MSFLAPGPIGRDTKNPGILGFRAEGRYRLGTDVPPQGFGGEIGSVSLTGVGYSDFDFSLTELWWEQHIIEDRVAFRIGKMLPFAIYDYFSLKNPKSGFTNSSFTLNPTIAWPQFGLGAAGIVRPTDEIFVVFGIHDANGRPTLSGFDTFFNDKEYFSVVDIGWDPGYLAGSDNPGDYHLTVWHTDKREKAGRPEGWGITAFAEQRIGRFLPFLRYGYSDDATLFEHMVATGVGFMNVFGENQNVIGIGLSWGKPTAKRLDDEYAGEIFYRMQLTPRLAITPNVQLIIDPARNPDEDVIGVFGIRSRLAF